MIFQDPFSSLDPARCRSGTSVAEPLLVHFGMNTVEPARAGAGELLERCRPRRAPPSIALPAPSCRVASCSASPSPAPSPCEPAAHRVRRTRRRPRRVGAGPGAQPDERAPGGVRACAYLFISHDLALVEVYRRPDRGDAQRRDRRAGLRRAIFAAPEHDYTRELLAAIPVPGSEATARLGEEPVMALQRKCVVITGSGRGLSAAYARSARRRRCSRRGERHGATGHGSIVNVTSGAHAGIPMMGIYGATKGPSPLHLRLGGRTCRQRGALQRHLPTRSHSGIVDTTRCYLEAKALPMYGGGSAPTRKRTPRWRCSCSRIAAPASTGRSSASRADSSRS